MPLQSPFLILWLYPLAMIPIGYTVTCMVHDMAPSAIVTWAWHVGWWHTNGIFKRMLVVSCDSRSTSSTVKSIEPIVHHQYTWAQLQPMIWLWYEVPGRRMISSYVYPWPDANMVSASCPSSGGNIVPANAAITPITNYGVARNEQVDYVIWDMERCDEGSLSATWSGDDRGIWHMGVIPSLRSSFSSHIPLVIPWIDGEPWMEVRLWWLACLISAKCNGWLDDNDECCCNGELVALVVAI